MQFLPIFDFPQGGETQFSAIFDFPQGGESRFFPISDKKLRFFDSQRLFLSKNCDFLLPTANSVKKLRFFCSQRLILSKNCDFSTPDAHFCKKRGAVLLIRGLGSVEILVFYSSEGSAE